MNIQSFEKTGSNAGMKMHFLTIGHNHYVIQETPEGNLYYHGTSNFPYQLVNAINGWKAVDINPSDILEKIFSFLPTHKEKPIKFGPTPAVKEFHRDIASQINSVTDESVEE